MTIFQHIFLIIYFTILTIFSISFLGKVSDMTNFIESINGFQILPTIASKFVAVVVLFTEFSIVLLFLSGQGIQLALLLSTLLLFTFSVVLILVIRKNQYISCNCFGSSDRIISKSDVIRNIILIIFSISGISLIQEIDFGSNIFLSFEVLIPLVISIICVTIITNLQEYISVYQKSELFG